MKFVIFGAGGTGGILAAYLALHGEDVTLIARGQHLAAIQAQGLLLHTEHKGDLHVPKENLHAMEARDYDEIPDVLFICVKYYALLDAIDFARRVADKNTLIIPILNVFGTGAVMQAVLPNLCCLDGCIYVLGHIESPGVIAQPQKILRVLYGFRPEQLQDLKPKAETLEKVLQAAEIHAHLSENIRRDALRKFAFVSPMGAAGLYLHVQSEAFQKPGEARELFIGLIKEVEALGTAMEITFENNLVADGLKLIDSFKPHLVTSMQRDVEKGKTSEFDGLVRHVVQLAKEYGSSAPLYTKIAHWGDNKGL